MADRRRFGIEERKDICTEEWGVKSRNNLVTPVARHGERWKMTKLVIRNYWWLGVTKDIGKYVNRCDMC